MSRYNNNNTHIHITILQLSEFCPGQPKWAGTRRNIHPLSPIVVIGHLSSAFSIYYNPWQLLCSIHVPDSLFPQSAWYPALHTPYISSPKHYLLFTAYAHTIATCFAVVLRLCHLNLVSLRPLYLELYLVAWCHISIWYSHLCLLKGHLIFLPYRPGLTSMQHTTSHTTAVQSSSHYQWYILTGKQWYQLLKFIPSNSNSRLHRCISISICTQHITKLIH